MNEHRLIGMCETLQKEQEEMLENYAEKMVQTLKDVSEIVIDSLTSEGSEEDLRASLEEIYDLLAVCAAEIERDDNTFH